MCWLREGTLERMGGGMPFGIVRVEERWPMTYFHDKANLLSSLWRLLLGVIHDSGENLGILSKIRRWEVWRSWLYLAVWCRVLEDSWSPSSCLVPHLAAGRQAAGGYNSCFHPFHFIPWWGKNSPHLWIPEDSLSIFYQGSWGKWLSSQDYTQTPSISQQSPLEV